MNLPAEIAQATAQWRLAHGYREGDLMKKADAKKLFLELVAERDQWKAKASAYPRLVEALRRCINWKNEAVYFPDIENAKALLSELGEL